MKDNMRTNNPFLVYSQELNGLFKKAAKQKQPGLWLFSNKARGTLFMLESLCRLYDKWLQDARFTHWHAEFKKLEDLLGEIDVYDTFIKEFSETKKIPADSLYYMQSKREKALKKFDKYIKKQKYLKKGVGKFAKQIHDMHLRFDTAVITVIGEAIQTEINVAEEFAAYNDYHYSELEDHVHELRRKLRWIGMYTESLHGMVKLSADGNKYKWERKYLNKKSLSSPFNRVRASKSFTRHIEFEKKHFVALNQMIKELGEIKDDGINTLLLAKAIRKTEKVEHETAVKKAMHILGIRQTEAAIVKKGSAMAKDFFETNKIMQGLCYIRPQKLSIKKAPRSFRLQLTIRNKKI